VAKGSVVDEFEPRIRELLAEFPDMPATVIAERLGWARSITVFRERVTQLRPLFAPADPVSRTSYAPGELAQCDLWFPPVDIPVGFGQVARPPVLTMLSGYSRRPGAVMIRPARPMTSSPGTGACSPGGGQCRGPWSGTVRRR
jgi:hypothetical protein